ncbi:hypothetical protein [Methanogenium sp. MK-MG]|uniref:hypothetical protein n=1 Tax=Methanogenium sp. MK-MG TaxID=2599926 RepID=UPI0013EA5C33|nr:hypothetical protein [Methanogenium sp. MK-MG]
MAGAESPFCRTEELTPVIGHLLLFYVISVFSDDSCKAEKERSFGSGTILKPDRE